MITGFGNNVVSALAADITASQTTIQVMPGAGEAFARLLTYDYQNTSNDLRVYAKITLTDAGETEFEVCHLTAVNNDMLTVVRGQEGTAAKGWSLTDVVANFATRGSENQFVQIEHLQSGHYTSGVAGGTANALTLDLPASYFVNGSTSWELRAPLVVYPSENNTGPATMQLTMGGRPLGTFKLYKGNRSELAANDILKDVAMVCVLDRTKEFFSVSNPGAIYAGLGTAAFRNVVDSAPGDLIPVGYKGIFASDAFHAPIDFATYPFVVGESLFVDARSSTNNPPFLNQDFYYIDVVCATGPAQGGRVNRPLIQFVSYSNSTAIYAIREDDGTTIGWRYFRAVQYDADNVTITAPGGVRDASYYSTKPGHWQGGGAFQQQYTDGTAPFYIPYGFATPQDVSIYLPIIKGNSVTEGYGFGASVSFGILRSGKNDFGSAVIHIIGDSGGGAAFSFGYNGDFGAPGSVFGNAGVFDSGERVYSRVNPPPQPDLSPYATQAWVAANFLQGGQRLASLGTATNNNNDNEFAYAPDGSVVTAVMQKTNYTAVQYRHVQYNINGNWYTAWVA
ncbi:hypothetical protein [Enterobacter asburiae]|uniref:hypothetical protein n=1 Tax=Enterobacter asburiae TaxID=61645 RepID=UPI00210990A8|nr:hypothetical protein [Enterobacter asburiae]MCQ4369977.1 hypothetical protein [Enterobacter asburiae]